MIATPKLTVYLIDFMEKKFESFTDDVKLDKNTFRAAYAEYQKTLRDGGAGAAWKDDVNSYIGADAAYDILRHVDMDKKLTAGDISLIYKYAHHSIDMDRSINDQNRMDNGYARLESLIDLDPPVAAAVKPAVVQEAGQKPPVTVPPKEQKTYTNDPNAFYIVPGTNPEKVTIYYYKNKHERLQAATYQSGDEIGSTKIFIKENQSLETIEKAIGYYCQSQFGKGDHKLSNIKFEGHGRPEFVGDNESNEIEILNLWALFDRFTDNIDMSSCSVLDTYADVMDNENIEMLQDKIKFADSHNLNIMANSVIGYRGWGDPYDNSGPGGRPYILDADGGVKRVRRAGDEYLGSYVESARAYVGSLMHKLWKDMGGEYATEHEKTEGQTKIVKWSQASINKM